MPVLLTDLDEVNKWLDVKTFPFTNIVDKILLK